MKRILRFTVHLLILVLLASSLPPGLYAAAPVEPNLKPPQQTKKKKPSKKKSPKKRSSKPKKKTSGKSSSSKKAAQAKKYTDRGKKRIKAKNYQGALKDFKAADKLKPSKATKSYIKKLTGLVNRGKKSAPERTETAKRIPEPKSVYQVSDNIYRMTYRLDASTQRIRSARLALKPIDARSESRITLARMEKLEKKALNEPTNPNAQRDLALEYEKKGAFGKARDIYMRLISSEPLNPDYHYFLGAMYSSMGQDNKAGYAFQEVLEIDPNHLATVNALSVYTGRPGGSTMAEDLMQEAATKAPEGPAQLLKEVRENLQSGAYNDVISKAQEGEKRYPKNAVLPYMRGLAHEAEDDLQSAKKAYKRSIELNQSDPSAALALGDLYSNQGNYLYAAISYEGVLDKNPRDVVLRFKHGLSYYKAYEWAKCASAWEDLLHYAPNHTEVRKMLPQVYYILSMEYNRNGFTDLSRQTFANAISVNPASSEWLGDALNTAGEYYRDNGMYRESLRAYQDAMELSPQKVNYYNGLGATYWYMGEKEMAVAAWEKSLSLKSDDNAARGWLLLADR